MSGWSHRRLEAQLWLAGRLFWRPFAELTKSPEATQLRVLQAILRRNRSTVFAREHGFASIRTLENFADAVPIMTYEELRPYIERQETERRRELLTEAPLMYARTSGSTGEPKNIPITRDTIARAKRNQQRFAYCQHVAVPGLYAGKTLAFVSPAIEGRLPSGTPYGSMSGFIYENMPRSVRRNYLVPPAVFACGDHELRYLLIALFAIAEDNVTLVAGANPTTFLKIARTIQTRAEEIVAALASGRLPGREYLPADVLAALEKTFSPRPDRARRLREILTLNSAPLFSALWPGLKALSCWREGNGRLLLPALRELIASHVPILELGYLATEFRGSLPVDACHHREVPTLHEHYFEFVERSAWDDGDRATVPLHALEVGNDYYVIVTTPDGLYRYFINDVITVDGRFHATPTIKFLEKGLGATNLTGEKLYESQVCSALEAVQARAGWKCENFVLVAEASELRYRLYLESPELPHPRLADDLDRELARLNLEYAAKRASGRLQPIEVRLVHAGTGDAWKAELVRRGQRESQFKFVRLIPRDKLTFDLDARRLR